MDDLQMAAMRRAKAALDIAVTGMSEEAKALNRIADALEKQAEATLLLARATAGEFDEPEEVPDPPQKGKGMGMGG